MDSLIVQMPRFNKNVFEVGMAIQVTDKSTYPEVPMNKTHCLIKKVDALKLEVFFIGQDGEDYTHTINVDDVASGAVIIELLTVSPTPVGDEDTKDFSMGRF
jgi:hypothetical protein